MYTWKISAAHLWKASQMLEYTSDMPTDKGKTILNLAFYTTNQVWWQKGDFRYIRSQKVDFLSNLSWENTSGLLSSQMSVKPRERKDAQDPANRFKEGSEGKSQNGSRTQNPRENLWRGCHETEWVTLRICWWCIDTCQSEKNNEN